MEPRANDERRGIGDVAIRAREWVLLDGARSAVSAVVVCFVVGAMALVTVAVDGLFRTVQPLFYVYGGLVGGNLTLVTVVVSINQLLLSRELSTPDELRSQIEGSIDYHQDVEEIAGRAVPVEPQGFLRVLFHNTRQAAQQLGGLSFEEADEGVYEDIDDIVTKVTRHAADVERLLQNSDASTFSVLSTTLTTNYAREINRLRHLRAYEAEHLPIQADDAIDELVHRLQDIDVARQYFKSVYLEQELAWLSRLLVYTGLPSVTAVAVTLVLLTGRVTAVVPGGLFPALVIGTITAGLVPMAVLIAFILRTATVTKRTAATIPFTAPAQEYH